MADAEQSQSRCLIWGTETQRMNELEHNTHMELVQPAEARPINFAILSSESDAYLRALKDKFS